jgi:hypothetical protein
MSHSIKGFKVEGFKVVREAFPEGVGFKVVREAFPEGVGFKVEG